MNKLKNEKNLLSVVVTITVFALIISVSIFTNKAPNAPETKTQSESSVSVHFIDVGQGDCILIRTSTSNVLIDSGENEYAATVTGYLNSLKISKLDLIIATHPHSDHIGALDDIIKNFGTEKIIMPKLSEALTPTTKCYRDLLEAIASVSLKITAAEPGEVLNLGEASLEILAPVKQYDDLNENSVVCKLIHQNNTFFVYGRLRRASRKRFNRKR